MISEIGIHQLDLNNWFLNKRPAAVSGFGGIMFWNRDKDNDDREVADTIQTVCEYPGGTNLLFDCTLANSFDGEYNIMHGSGGAIMMRGNKAWLFKEADADQLGWEVYARHEKFYEETGIALVAGASKSVQKAQAEKSPFETSSLHHAMDAFITNCNEVAKDSEDFATNYPDSKDIQELRDYLATMVKGRSPAAGYLEGYEATVIALKANEAIRTRQRIELGKELFEI